MLADPNESPRGAAELRPALQRWENVHIRSNPVGTSGLPAFPMKRGQEINSRKTVQKKKPRIPGKGLLLGLTTLIGTIAAVVTLLPRVTAIPADPVDPSDPFSAYVVITNTGYVPLSSVSAYLTGGYIAPEGVPVQPRKSFTPGTRLFRPEWLNHHLGLDDKFTIDLNDLIRFKKSPVAQADIGIVVTYRPWRLPLHREKIFRLVLHKRANGQLYWYGQPLD